ncbi:MAG: peptidoglycan DD-metalloendopeptidase family protein [Caldicoprobacterales bacterium]|jgi:murein DD-endopeptidase MepM/ murein hydrolase activator NlpD|nr:M23 family metallopeptidase [Clostridiales bacterium]
MEEKEPVVIQGRTIRRERQAERPASDRYAYTGSVKTRNRPDRYSLSALRENRRLRGVQKPRIRPRTGTGGWADSRAYYGDNFPGRKASAGSHRLRRHNEEAISQNNPLMIKIAVSVLLALVVLLLNYIQMPFTQAIVGHVKTALTQDFDLDETLGKLKFVGSALPEEIKAVFGENSGLSFASPARGKVIHTFGERVSLPDTGKSYINQGIDIETRENAPFFAAASGVVAEIIEHEIYGGSLWLDHGDGIFSFYGRCGNIEVKKGEKVRSGQKLGMVNTPAEGHPILHFQIWMDDKPVDPLERITQAGQEGEERGV